MRWFRMRVCHSRWTTMWSEGWGFGSSDISSTFWERGAGDWIQPHGQWFNQWWLHNETLIKTEKWALMSFRHWQYSVLLPEDKEISHLESSQIPLCVSYFGWFWFVSFGSNKIVIISIYNSKHVHNRYIQLYWILWVLTNYQFWR